MNINFKTVKNIYYFFGDDKMLKIAIIGDFYETKQALQCVLNIKHTLINIENCNKNQKIDCDILIINKILHSKTIYFPNKCIVLLNYDNINFSDLKIYSSNIITYGINTKSIITFSSIQENVHSKILFCIQKSLKSLTGKTIYEQEFPIYYNLKNLYVVLSSVTVAILNDINFN